jgi:quercetin dioxygenase-like cupin family protein
MPENSYNPEKALKLEALIEYQTGAVVSREIYRTEAGTLTVFAFDSKEGLSVHTAPFDAFVQILDGTAKIQIGETETECTKGELILMPANVPHGLKAVTKFKMLLTMMRKIT